MDITGSISDAWPVHCGRRTLRHALDSLDTATWVKRWIPPFLRGHHNPDVMASELDNVLVAHRRGLPDAGQPWGFKNPRGILLLPFYTERLPAMRFIHIVRDGRDMAFSSNITQVLWYGDLILPERLKTKPIPVRAMAMWALVTSQTHRVGGERLGNRYLLVRFEDLCANPQTEVAPIFQFIEADTSRLAEAVAEIHQPTEAGRWRDKDPALVASVLAEAGHALANSVMPSNPNRPWQKHVYDAMGGPGPWRRLTASKRGLPDFLIIGAMRAGTTSLHSYINQHPQVAPALRKEIHFFDRNFHKGLGWYRAHFPCCRAPNILTGEDTPYYLFHPAAPRRIMETLPTVTLIAILRHPVNRAYSHYWQKIRRGRETLSFVDALAAEDGRLQGETERLRDDPGHHSFNHNHFAYRARGRYAEQLERWFDLVPRDRLLVVSGEELCRESQRVP